MTGTEISYGKAHVVFYRLGGRDLAPLAASVDVDVTGERFLRAYTEGDNREVVATDTMKNFIYAMAAEYGGSTLLGLCAFLGRHFLQCDTIDEQVCDLASRNSVKAVLTVDDPAGSKRCGEAEVAKPQGLRPGWSHLANFCEFGKSGFLAKGDNDRIREVAAVEKLAYL